MGRKLGRSGAWIDCACVNVEACGSWNEALGSMMIAVLLFFPCGAAGTRWL